VVASSVTLRRRRVAHLLRGGGLQRRDHTAIFMDNDPRMLVCEAGAYRTGLYSRGVNSYLSAQEAAYIINDAIPDGGDRRCQGQGGVSAPGTVPERPAVAYGRCRRQPARAIRVLGRPDRRAARRPGP